MQKPSTTLNQDTLKSTLLTFGKSKGNKITEQQLSELLTLSKVPTDEIPGYKAWLESEGVSVVEQKKRTASKAKSAAKTGRDADDEPSRTNDPVRMYLRKMGSVSLLTREGEVEIAKRIEQGEERVLDLVFKSPVAVPFILEMYDSIKRGKIRLKDMVTIATPNDLSLIHI